MQTPSKLDKLKKRLKKYKLYFPIFIICILSLVIFIKLLEDVLTYGRITKIDLLINSKVTLLWNPILDKTMLFITNIVSPSPLIILSFLLSLFLIYKKRHQKFFILAFSLIAGLLSEVVIKFLIHRLRPTNSLIQVTRYSFPSGHATISIIFFSFLIYCFKDEIKNKLLKTIFILASIILFLIIGFSRIYLDVHWFSDVVAGFSLGAFWLSLSILIFNLTKIFDNKI